MRHYDGVCGCVCGCVRGCTSGAVPRGPPVRRGVVQWLYSIGGGRPPPSPPDQRDNRGKQQNLPLGKSGQAIFGTQTSGSQTPPPPRLSTALPVGELLTAFCPSLPNGARPSLWSHVSDCLTTGPAPVQWGLVAPPPPSVADVPCALLSSPCRAPTGPGRRPVARSLWWCSGAMTPIRPQTTAVFVPRYVCEGVGGCDWFPAALPTPSPKTAE